MENLECYIDGDALCIVQKGFINLHQDEAMFIDLTEEEIKEFNKLGGIKID